MDFKKLKINPDIKKQIQEALDLLTEVYGKNLHGVYLYGSAVVGGLQKYSDLDLFVVLDRASTNPERSNLTKGLLKISGLYMQGEKPPIEMTIVEKTAVNPSIYGL